MKLIFDFDHTVFDMMEMHAAIFAAMKKIGVTEEQYNAAYDQITKWKMFTTDGLANALAKTAGVNEARVIQALEGVAKETELYVYDDVPGAFQELLDSGHKISLLSWGDKDWQDLKIKHSGLMPFCEEVVSVTQVKADYIQKKYDSLGCLVVIDDKIAELKAIQAASPEMKLIRMRREGAKYSEIETPHGIMEAKDMSEVVKILSEMKCPIHG